MKHSRTLLILVTFLFFLTFAACGGGGSGGAAGTDVQDPSIDVPADTSGNGDDAAGEDAGAAGDDDYLPVIPVPPPATAPEKVLIVGSIVDAEGIGMSGVTITFYSDPVTATTDAGGVFQAVLEVGSHTFEFTSGALGSMSGGITVTAAGIINDAGQLIGNFVADSVGDAVCQNLRLVDLGKSAGGNTAWGVLTGTFGNEIDSQGTNQTAMIVGNSEMAANVSLDGRISGLWFPTVGAYNHVPYLSDVDDWVKPFQGSFGGIKRGDNYYWLTDTDHFDPPTIEYQSGTYAPIVEITHVGTGVCSGARIKEKIYVAYDTYTGSGGRSNVLIRDFQIESPTSPSLLCRTTANAPFSPELALYSRYNPSSRHQLFKQWVPELIEPECASDRMTWVQPSTSHYTIMMEGMNSTGSKLAMTCRDVISSDDARIIDPEAGCAPLGVKGEIAGWTIPSTKRVIVSTAGCGLSGDPCSYALNQVERSVGALEATAKTRWNSWLAAAGTESVSDSTWRDRYKRWLVSLKMLADRNTGAIIAAPSQEPTYYCSWPRDGVFQSVAYITAGKLQEAAAFFNYLFKTAQDESTKGWTQAYSSLDGAPLGLPSFPSRLNIEEDQPPTVLWGLWVYWRKNSMRLPTGISVDDVKEVADYVTARICPTTNMIWPSLDWHENPAKDIGQSLYTNAAAYAGLLAAAEMVGSSDTDAAEEYREAAMTIKSGVETYLCPSGSCYPRLKYDPLLIPNLGNPAVSCGYCSIAPYSDDEGEYIMAFAWPFHLFELGDARVQSYYRSTLETHNDLGEFTHLKSLWIPRYLYTYLYAREAYANSEVPSGSFKTELNDYIGEVERDFPDLITTGSGFLMDQYVGGYEEEIYGDNYEDRQLGSAARPLGWSQAMGVMAALAREGERVPMIDEPAPATSCVPGSGPCCDASGDFLPSTRTCSTSTEYACPDGTACGADVKTRMVMRYCSGSAASCSGSTVPGTWSVADDCAASEMCVAGNPVCQACGTTCECSSGTCCDGCHYRPTTYACGSETRYICERGTSCGDDVTMSARTRYCSGSSSSCSGAYDPWIAPVPADDCTATEICVSGNTTCQSSPSCTGCECTSGPCCDGCHFRPSSYHCDAVTELGCPWGTDCNDDVGSRTGNRHCSGSSASCSGTTGDWNTWAVSGTPCNNRQACSTSTLTCETPSRCACDPITTWPADLYATGVIAGVMLEWTAATGASEYIITRSFGSGCPPLGMEIKRTPDRTTIDRTAPSGTPVTYGIYAVDTCGNVSACADFATATRL